MIKDIREKITETTIEAIELAIKMMEASNEAFAIHTSIPKKLNKATVSITAAKRPFPLNKFPYIQHAVGGKFHKAPTLEKFTQLIQYRHSSIVRLVIHLYFRECLNPASWDKVEVQKGSRGRVLTPELCDGAEFSIMRGLGVKEEKA
jgi:hypothetical protein